MAITYIPPQKNWIDKFTEGMAPYLQAAFAEKLRKASESEKETETIKAEERAEQRTIAKEKRATQQKRTEAESQQQSVIRTYPDAFTTDYEAASRGAGAEGTWFSPSVPQSLKQKAYQKFSGKETVPSKYVKFSPEGAKQAYSAGTTIPTIAGVPGAKYAVPKQSVNISDPQGLTSDQQVKARALSRRLYGVRGAQFGLPPIYEEMRKGKSIDQIEDSLRFAGQSPEFAGAIRNSVQTLLLNTDERKAQTSMDYIDDLVSEGNLEGAKQQIKRLARKTSGVEEGRMVNGTERTVKLLDEIQDDLSILEQSGIDTNIFTGTREDISKRIGMVAEPEMRRIATKIAATIQSYRRAMTGVQFGMPENIEYKDMFPSIGRTANFNTASIQGLKEVLSGNLENFYTLSMGEDNYAALFGDEQVTQPAQQQGEEQQLDANTAQQLLQQAGGDKEKARELATQMGYTF